MPRAARTFRTASTRSILGLAALALLGACGRQSALDSGLNKDLVLADQLQQRSAPPLVVTQDSAAAAPTEEPAYAPVGETMRTRFAARTVAPAHLSPRPATAAVVAVAPTHAGSYTPGHADGGDVIGTGPAAPTDRDASTTDATSRVGVYGATTSGTSTPVYRQPQAHAERDAIVGSVAGAIIGAAAGHGVRGGLIGAVAGGALGAIYGGSVDRSYPGYPTYAGTHTSRAYRTNPGFRSVPSYHTF